MFCTSHSSAGGAQELWVNLADGFRVRGVDVRLVALYPLRAQVRETPDGLPWHYAVPRQPRNPLEVARLFASLVRMIRDFRPEIIYTALPAANVLLSAAAAVAGTGARVVTSHHSPSETHSRLLNTVDALTGRLPSVAHIVSVSNTVSTSLDAKPAAYKAKRVTVYNALPPMVEQRLEALSAARTQQPARPRRLVATGRLAAQKNYPVLIRAMAHLPDAEADIVGSGPDEAALRALATELGVQDRVHFHGQQTRIDALTILAGGDIFVQMSLFEGHSLALIEAAKLGLPLIVSDVPVQVEGVTSRDGTRCAAIVPPHDDAGLAAAVAALRDDPGRYAEAVRKSRKLGSEQHFADMVSAYASLAAA